MPAAAAQGETATIAASTSLIVFGEQVQLSGAVSGDAACLGPRTIQLEWRQSDSPTWAVVATGTTAADGTYALADGQQYTGAYRVELPDTGTCGAVASDEAGVAVRALVDSSLVASSLTAGSCPNLHVTISPDKAGQSVEVQQRTPSGWHTNGTLTLDSSSSADSKPCFGWEDIGVVRLRVLWPAQDSLNAAGTGIVLAFQITKAPWMQRIDGLTAGRSFSVSVGEDGSFLYQRADTTPRPPASNEKLLLSMALLDTFGPGFRIVTHAAARSTHKGIVRSNLWILGRGDPELTPGRMAALATRLVEAGVRKVHGRVMGSTNYFLHDRWAVGWHRSELPDIAPPTALTFDGNIVNGHYTQHPELLAARSLTEQLKKRGVVVTGKPGVGTPPPGLSDVAAVRSRPLGAILTRMNRPSDNFYAEVLGKLLGATTAGPPGTIPKGAAAISAWVADHGVHFSLHDSSGLSYANRVTAQGILRLLWAADAATWGNALRQTLPTGGQGTLEDRLHGVRVLAKTGTLTGISALSGWVWLEKEQRLAEFSILSTGMEKWVAAPIEDRIVRILTTSAR